MTEGISKETLIRLMQDPNCDSSDYATYDYLLSLCTDLDPWLPIDENTPKDKELLLITKEYGVVIGKYFAAGKNGWWTTPTHYKLLPPMPPTEQPDTSPKTPGPEISPNII